MARRPFAAAAAAALALVAAAACVTAGSPRHLLPTAEEMLNPATLPDAAVRALVPDKQRSVQSVRKWLADKTHKATHVAAAFDHISGDADLRRDYNILAAGVGSLSGGKTGAQLLVLTDAAAATATMAAAAALHKELRKWKLRDGDVALYNTTMSELVSRGSECGCRARLARTRGRAGADATSSCRSQAAPPSSRCWTTAATRVSQWQRLRPRWHCGAATTSAWVRR